MMPSSDRAAEESAVLADAGPLDKLIFRGPDRREFLQGLLTNDVLGISPGRGAPCCLLTIHGKIVADFHLYVRDDDCLALLAPGGAARLTAGLAKYLPLSDTSMEDARLGAFWATGPRSADVLAAATGIWTAAYDGFGREGTMALFPAERAGVLRAALDDALRAAGGSWADAATLEAWRVEAGLPRWGAELDAERYPAEVNLEGAVSHTKGCYLGQETTARLKNHGRLKRRLAALRLARSVPVGSPVLVGGREVGQLTSVVESGLVGGPLALALLDTDASAPGAVLFVADGTRADVISFPRTRD